MLPQINADSPSWPFPDFDTISRTTLPLSGSINVTTIEFGPVPSATQSIIQGSFSGESNTAVSTVPLPLKNE